MSNNLENDRSVTSNKMYPIDLAPQKITIVKSVPNSEVKMAHLISGPPKNSGGSQIITHTGPIGLIRPAAQIISPNVTSQPQMIVSGTPIIQGTQIVSQGSQLINQGSQMITQSQLIGSSGLLAQSTQIISQGNQGNSTNVGSNIITGTGNNQCNVSPVSGTQVLNVAGQLVSGTGSLVVSSSVRALSPSVRVLPPMQHHTNRPVLSAVSLGSNNSSSGGGGVVVSKGISSHVPRGPAAGASLAVPRVATRPITPVTTPIPISTLGGAWSGAPRGGVRGALVYPPRAAAPRPPPPRAAAPLVTPVPAPAPVAAHSAIVTLPSTTVLASSGVIAASVRGGTPRASTPTPASIQRPLPLLQRNYQPSKIVGVASVGVRTPVGNSAPSQLYYEVSRPPAPHSAPPAHPAPAPAPATALPRVLTPYNHIAQTPAQVSGGAIQVLPESRVPVATISTTTVLPRPSILRKREIDGSPSKTAGVGPPLIYEPRSQDGWDEVLERAGSGSGSFEGEVSGGGGGGSTTVSAASSPAPDDEPMSPPRAPTPQDISPRKKPRKQMLSSGVRQCDFPAEETPLTPPPAPVPPPPKRPLLSSSFVCGWRATALHFTRPADVRRREPRAKDIVALANQKHILNTADGWKVHHLTAQMDDLVSLESDVSEQLAGILHTIENAHGKAQSALAPHSHTLLELVKGNIQRSRIVCEGIHEARDDILRVFTHRTFVADILTRQADKRCYRKHRSQS